MKRDEVLRKLKEAEADLRAQGVAHAALFGSVARGEDRSDSDIDIMIEIAPESRMDLLRYVGIVQYVEELLFPVPVDVANREGLRNGGFSRAANSVRSCILRFRDLVLLNFETSISLTERGWS
jgi:uncharacterized protein